MAGENPPVQARSHRLLPHPSNLGRTSASSALRGTRVITVCIEIRRNLWTPRLHRADDGSQTSSAPAAVTRGRRDHPQCAAAAAESELGGNGIARCTLLTWRRSGKGGKIKLELPQPCIFLQENFLCS